MKNLLVLLMLFMTVQVSANIVTLKRQSNNAVYEPDASKIAQPGDVVLLEGDYLCIKLLNLKGTKDKPIRIINKGLVTIGGYKDYTVAIEGEYFIIDGAGDANYRYGIKLNGKPGQIPPPHGFSTLTGRFYEIKNVEFVYGGIQQNPSSGSYPLEGIYLHDNYLHDCTGELTGGRAEWFYMGTTSGADTRNFRFVDCRIENNIMENTTGDGIQVGQGSFIVKNNVVKNFGRARIPGQAEGIQIGGFASGIFTGNTVDGGFGHAIIIMGEGNIEVSGNIFKNIDNNSFSTVTDAVYINNKSASKMNLAFRDNVFENISARYIIFNQNPDNLNGSMSFSQNQFINTKTIYQAQNNVKKTDNWKDFVKIEDPKPDPVQPAPQPDPKPDPVIPAKKVLVTIKVFTDGSTEIIK